MLTTSLITPLYLYLVKPWWTRFQGFDTKTKIKLKQNYPWSVLCLLYCQRCSILFPCLSVLFLKLVHLIFLQFITNFFLPTTYIWNRLRKILKSAYFLKFFSKFLSWIKWNHLWHSRRIKIQKSEKSTNFQTIWIDKMFLFPITN